MNGPAAIVGLFGLSPFEAAASRRHLRVTIEQTIQMALR
jgi:hypothetical protein